MQPPQRAAIQHSAGCSACCFAGICGAVRTSRGIAAVFRGGRPVHDDLDVHFAHHAVGSLQNRGSAGFRTRSRTGARILLAKDCTAWSGSVVGERECSGVTWDGKRRRKDTQSGSQTRLNPSSMSSKHLVSGQNGDSRETPPATRFSGGAVPQLRKVDTARRE